MVNKKAFTLAEVLITIGIIGIVAAMTIPTLMNNVGASKYRSKFKKAISTLSQAGRMSKALYEGDFTYADKCSDVTDSPSDKITFCAIFNGVLSGATMTKTTPYVSGELYSIPNPVYLTLADGSLVVFSGDAKECTLEVGTTLPNVKGEHCVGYVDVNGSNAPNKEVTAQDTSSSIFVPFALADDLSSANLTSKTIDGITVSMGEAYVPQHPDYMTDIYPIVFHDGTVEPATPAGRFVLFSKNITNNHMVTSGNNSSESSNP